MPNCLLGLGSNLGNREATLRSALAAIEALPDVRIRKQSDWRRSTPVGGPPGQDEFLNAVAVIESSVPPLTLLAELQDIERRHGRTRGERWAPRTLDVDLLLYGNEVSETEMLTLPHPRLSFRRFVLEPAAAIAPRMLHPVIGWPVERLLLHLNAASDSVAVLSPSQKVRIEVAALLAQRFGARAISLPTFATAEQHWPAAVASWLELPSSAKQNAPTGEPQHGPPYAAAAFPKLNILVDARGELSDVRPADWASIVRQPGRGPTLRLQGSDSAQNAAEIIAAVEAVWPDLGPPGANRLECLESS